MSEQYKLNPKGESYVFDSWDELLTKIEPKPTGIFPNDSSRSGRKEFCGTASFDEAISLARSGWLEPALQIEKVVGHVEARIDTTIIQTSFASRFDVAGGEVDIARFLDGEPECMIESEPIRISRHGRAVRVVVPGAFSAATDKDAIIGRGAAVIALSDVLAKAQHPLEIWLAYASGEDHDSPAIFQTLVRLQRADEPIDIGRLGFAVAHPSSLRRIGFAAAEAFITKPYVSQAMSWGYGYGTGQVDVSQLDEAENTIIVPALGYHGRNDWKSEEFCVEWVNEQLDRIFD